MLALVTGGAGFIGSHIVDRLLKDGCDVRVLDDFSTGKKENLPDDDRVELITGDVGDFATVEKAMQGASWVFHKAAVASVPRTVNDPLGSQKVNYQGTLNILESARQQGAQKVVFAASAAAYGDLPELPKKEDMSVKPLSPYAVDKLASEYACQVYHSLYGLDTACLRYFNVFGPRQDPSSPYSGVISIFVDRLMRKEQPTIFGDGEQTRDFVYVGDVVEANMKAVTTDAAAGQVFNIGTGDAVTLKQMLEILSRLTDMPFGPGFGPERAGDIRYSYANVNKAKEVLGWDAAVELEQGLKKLLDSL